MNYEEKYKAARERAKEMCAMPTDKATMEYIFPELKESEDEKIKKDIIRVFKGEISFTSEKENEKYIAWLEKQGKQKQPWEPTAAQLIVIKDLIEDKNTSKVNKVILRGMFEEFKQFTNSQSSQFSSEHLLDPDKVIEWLKHCNIAIPDNYIDDDNTIKPAIMNWLEKQGESKPADKVEPKFHDGDWVVYNNDICQIAKREEGCNKLVTIFGIEKELVNERNLSTARLWTIQDARDGDVLVASDESIFIYAGSTDRYAKFYVALTNYGSFNFDGGNWEDKNTVHPSTKKQRDFLFQKMKEAGYEWDTTKKELKEIKAKTLDPDKVIEWLECKAFQSWGEDINIKQIVDKFKKDFEL